MSGVGNSQLRGLAHHIGVGLGVTVLPHGVGQVTGKGGCGVAVVALAVLESQLRLVNIDTRNRRGSFRLGWCTSRIRRSLFLGRNGRSHRIAVIPRHINRTTRRIRDFHKGEITPCSVIRCAHLLRRRLRAQIIDMAVLPGQFRCNDGDIDLWNIKQASRNTLLRVNAGSISVGRHVVAANKSGLSLHRKLDNQFLAIRTIVLLVGDVVLIEIKSGHAHRVRMCVNRRLHVAAGRLLRVKALAVIIGGVKLHTFGVRRHSEIRCHNVFNNRRAAKVNARLTDILADRREDSAQEAESFAVR